MKKIFSQILDFPQMVNQKILDAKLNAAVGNFDSKDGVRCYVKSIYQIAALLVFIGMEVGLVMAAKDYFGGDSSILAKVGSVFAFVLLAYSAFPIAQVIRSRGDSLGESHSNMVEFLFKDFVMANIKIVGEVAAIAALFVAFNLTLSFVFNAGLMTSPSEGMTSLLGGFYSLPMDALKSMLSMLGVGAMGAKLFGLIEGMMSSAGSVDGWTWAGLITLIGAYVNVLIILAQLYVNLAIYKYVYRIVAAVVNFIPRFSIPISISNKN